MLQRREECNTYLINICRNQSSIEKTWWKANTVAFIRSSFYCDLYTMQVSTDVSQAGVALFPSFNIFFIITGIFNLFNFLHSSIFIRCISSTRDENVSDDRLKMIKYTKELLFTWRKLLRCSKGYWRYIKLTKFAHTILSIN